MRLIKNPRGDGAERLLAELKAIEEWDIAYWRSHSPDVYERTAFIARRSRRSEILCDLLNIFCISGKKVKNP